LKLIKQPQSFYLFYRPSWSRFRRLQSSVTKTQYSNTGIRDRGGLIRAMNVHLHSLCGDTVALQHRTSAALVYSAWIYGDVGLPM